FVAAVNRVGIEHEVRFWGHSFVADPLGRLVLSVGEGPLNPVVECDLGLIEATRRGWPFLRDRRIDAYTDLTRRFIDD
ncbi:MAG: acyltransferase, partial [Deltaproteobacteria bacterium]|nr:acyltransferase [Deltaproteobacteria bacterium]